MPKKISKEDEQKFIDYYTECETAGNATQAAKKAGFNNKQMGHYLKNKYATDIVKRIEQRKAVNKTKISGSASAAIDLINLLMKTSANDMCRLKSAERILDLGGYSSDQNINLNVEKEELKNLTDQELANKIAALSKKNPYLRKAMGETMSDDEEIVEQDAEAPEIDENRLTH